MIDLIQNSTIHGVSHIYGASNKIWKVFWFLLLFTGVVGIFVNIVFIVIKYLQHPILLSYTMESEPFVWPELTFCNPTAPYYLRDNSTEWKHWNEIIDKYKETSRVLANQSDVFRMIHGMNETDFELEERTIAMSSGNPEKLIRLSSLNNVISVGYTRAEGKLYFVRDFKGNHPIYLTGNLAPMFSTKFVQIRNNIPCFTFHIKRAQIPKWKFVDSFYFDIHLNYKSYEAFNSSYNSKSIFLYVTKENEIPQENEIILSPGFITTLVLTQSRYVYNQMKRKCRRNPYKVQLYDAFLTSTRTYEGSYTDCKKVVSQELFVKKCNCFSPFLPIYRNGSVLPRLCLNATHFSKSELSKNARCMTREYKKCEENEKFSSIFLKKCLKYRSRKCESVSYKTEQVYSMLTDLWSKSTNKKREIFWKKYSQTFGPETDKSDPLNYMRDNLIRLIVSRNSKYGELYREENEYPFSELLSDVGGLMGLWLGMSVVGLCELATMFYKYLRSFCKNGKMSNEEPTA